MNDPVLSTIASYEVKADEYIRNTDKMSYFPDLPAMLDKFISLLPGKDVLDVAFGAGRDTAYLLEHGLNVQGIEMSQVFIDTLRQKIDIPLYRMDMRRLEFEDNSFDGIWCCSAFLHLPRADALPTLQGFARVLRSNGILYIDLKEGDGEKWVNSPDGHVSDVPRFFTYYRAEEMCQLLEKAGFDVVLTRIQKHPKYAHKHNWINFISRKSM